MIQDDAIAKISPTEKFILHFYNFSYFFLHETRHFISLSRLMEVSISRSPQKIIPQNIAFSSSPVKNWAWSFQSQKLVSQELNPAKIIIPFKINKLGLIREYDLNYIVGRGVSSPRERYQSTHYYKYPSPQLPSCQRKVRFRIVWTSDIITIFPWISKNEVEKFHIGVYKCP